MNKNRMNTIVKITINPDDTTVSVFNKMVEFVGEYRQFTPAFYKKTILAGIKFGYEVNSVVFSFKNMTEEMLGQIIKTCQKQGIRTTLMWDDLDNDEANRIYYLKIRWADEPEDPEVPINNGGQ